MKWKDIKEYDGYYEVSDTGLVRGMDRHVVDSWVRTRLIRGRTIKLVSNAVGYYVVNLRKNGTMNVTHVHRLVAEAFLPNKDGLPTVNHIDGNKKNNSVANLEWASYGDNNIHALETGLRNPRGSEIIQKNISGDIIAVYKSTCEAARVTGIGRSMISHCINNRARTAGGYVWKKLLEGATTI